MHVAVYQPGRVGSVALFTAISKHIPDALHFHRQEGFPTGISGPGRVQRMFQEMEWNIGVKPEQAIHFITLVRDPVDQAVSRFFFQFKMITGTRFEDADQSPESLRNLFLEQVNHNYLEAWYDKHIVDGLGFDIYGQPFPDVGHAIHEGDGRRLLVLQTELTSEQKAELVTGFLQCDPIDLQPTNESSQQTYADAYAAFKTAGLPSDYLDSMYGTTYAQHFYTSEYIAQAKSRWVE